MKIFTPAQMREFDRTATEEHHIPSLVLMENAALRVVEFCETQFAPLRGKRVTVACGAGNNGGDGFAIARHLAAAGCEVSVVLAASKNKIKGDALAHFNALPSLDFYGANDDWPEADFVIDALLGTGFSGAVRRGNLADALEWLQMHPAPIVAVDVPSGLDSETGEAAQSALRADYTIAFAAPKRGFFARDGLAHCGEIWVGDIGTTPQQMDSTQTQCEATTRDYAFRLAELLRRAPDAHKGTAGRVLVVGGSRGLSGAVALAARAALNAGAGLCLAAVPDRILDTVAASVLEATTLPLVCDENGALVENAFAEIAEKWDAMQAVAIGPGVGRSDETFALVRRIARECPQSLIVDADALHALPAIAGKLKKRAMPLILTPHPGEMAALLETETAAIEADRFGAVLECARKYGAITVLKGARTLVCDGENVWINLSGNAGMATGGSGDALTGAIAGILAQLRGTFEDANQAAFYAAQLAVYAHGLAGDLAAQEKGNGLVAGDIVAQTPRALLALQTSQLPETINARLRKLQ